MITTAVAPAVVATAAVATAVADAAAGGQCPPPRSCSRVCCCSRSCPLLQLPRHPSPPRLQRPRKIQAPEEARSRIGMVGSVQCRKNVEQERYTQAVRHSAQESECLIFSSEQDSSVARRLPARPQGPTSPRTAHRTGTAVRGSRGPPPLPPRVPPTEREREVQGRQGPLTQGGRSPHHGRTACARTVHNAGSKRRAVAADAAADASARCLRATSPPRSCREPSMASPLTYCEVARTHPRVRSTTSVPSTDTSHSSPSPT